MRALNRRIRVAHVITRLNVGGPAIQVLLLNSRLDPERFESVLICGRSGQGEGDMRALGRVDHRPPILIPTLGREISILDDLRAFGALVGIFRALRPDVVHTNLAKAGLLGRLAARVAGVPVVVHTFHGNVLRGYFDPVRSRLFLTLERLLARVTSRVITLSPRQRAELAARGIASGHRVEEVPLGIDLAPFLEGSQGVLHKELRLASDIPLVGIVARLVPIKAVDVFLAAAEIVGQTRPGVRFVVVGDGPLRNDLERRVAKAGLEPRVAFLGWRADLPAIYADLDVVVLTSRNEGTPLSVIEALAAGRAVVATSVGGVPDLIEDGKNGLLVDVGDPLLVATAVERLLGDPALRGRLGELGRRSVYPTYDAATLVARMAGLYEELVVTIPSSRPSL